MAYPYIGDIDFSQIRFGAMQTGRDNRKSVEMFADDSSTAKTNYFKCQLCPDDESPVTTRYPLDRPPDGAVDKSRRGQSVRLPDETANAVKRLESAIVAAGVTRSKEWFKEELSEAQVRDKFQLVAVPETDQHNLKFKIKCAEAVVPTKVRCVRRLPDKTFTLHHSDEREFERAGASVVPLLSSFGLWFMGSGSHMRFGIGLQAEDIIVEPGAPMDELYRYSGLKRTYRHLSDEALSADAPIEGYEAYSPGSTDDSPANKVQ